MRLRSRPLAAFAFAVVLGLPPALARAEGDEKTLKEADVPKTVVDALRKKYPDAKVRGWTSEKESKDDKDVQYVARISLTTKNKEGKEEARKIAVTIFLEGKIKEEEETIAFDALPEVVRKTFGASKYAKAKVKEVSRYVLFERADDPGYSVLLDVDGKEVELTFDKGGRMQGGDEDEKPDEPAMK